jgi:hypothetical protein
MKRVRRVLVLEHDHDIRQPFARFLADAGYEVQTRVDSASGQPPLGFRATAGRTSRAG